MSKSSFMDIDVLLQQLLDEQIQSDEMERLQKAIKEDPRIRDFYIDSMLACAVLRRSSQVTEALTVSDRIHTFEGIQDFTRRITKNRYACATIIVLAIVVFSFVGLFRHKDKGPVIGKLTGIYAVKWQGRHPGIDKPLYVGLYDLREGVARLEMGQGVNLLLEAPCQIEFKNSREVILKSGRFVVKVPPGANGFQVRTLTALITDWGTEFGVIVRSDGSTEAHVFNGQINVELDPDLSQKLTSRIVNQGQAMSVDPAGQSLQGGLSAQSDLFLLDFPLPGQANKIADWVSLADFVGGGNGRGTGKLDQGIDVGTGRVFTHPSTSIQRSQQSKFQMTPELRGIDGVFVPDQALGSVVISSTGLIFSQCPRISGSYFGGPANSGKFYDIPSQQNYRARLNGIIFGTFEHPALTLHPNAGITFDLDQIRQEYPELKIDRFSSMCGISQNLPQTQFSSTDVWILLDGIAIRQMRFTPGSSIVEKIDVPLPGKVRFLTLVTTCSGRADYSWIFFGDPFLVPAQSDQLDH